MKTTELSGAALDWAVAKCESKGFAIQRPDLLSSGIVAPLPYSTDWAQGGPIIEREGITLNKINTHSVWVAHIRISKQQQGPAPLIAAMRCYVASKLGDEVEVHEQLL